jgi:hypothetical protein
MKATNPSTSTPPNAIGATPCRGCGHTNPVGTRTCNRCAADLPVAATRDEIRLGHRELGKAANVIGRLRLWFAAIALIAAWVAVISALFVGNSSGRSASWIAVAAILAIVHAVGYFQVRRRPLPWAISCAVFTITGGIWWLHEGDGAPTAALVSSWVKIALLFLGEIAVVRTAYRAEVLLRRHPELSLVDYTKPREALGLSPQGSAARRRYEAGRRQRSWTGILGIVLGTGAAGMVAFQFVWATERQADAWRAGTRAMLIELRDAFEAPGPRFVRAALNYGLERPAIESVLAQNGWLEQRPRLVAADVGGVGRDGEHRATWVTETGSTITLDYEVGARVPRLTGIDVRPR